MKNKKDKKKKEKRKKIEEVESEKKSGKNQVKEENKILKNVFITIGAIIILILVGYLIIDNMKNFEYKGIEFETVKFCDVRPCLILYQTTFPVISNGEKAIYNVYLRNNPKNLDNIVFDGEINLLGNMVINSTGDFTCDGDGVIAIANLVKFYELFGTNVFKNETLTCDNENRYGFLQIKEGNETKIKQTGNSCYDIEINSCEILEGTERFMIELFIEANKLTS